MKHDYFENPGLLKIDLMLRGLRIDDPVVKAWACGSAGVDLVLPENTVVNIPCWEEFAKHSPYLLKKNGDGYSLTDGRSSIEVSLAPRPAFYDRKTKSGVYFSNIVSVRGNVAVVTPSRNCGFFNTKVECKYCAGNFDKTSGAHNVDFTVDEVLEAVDAVFAERKTQTLYLSVGFSDTPDGGIVFLKPYLQAIKANYRCLVAVEAMPPKENSWIDETYALGADSVLYNLEIFDKELFKLICPGRAELIGQKRYLEALAYAASVFPNGTVASHLIVGLEPPGSTNQGIDALTAMKVVPILPIYRPSTKKALRIDPLSTEIIVPVYRHLYKAVKMQKISLNWVKDLSMVTTPIEIRGLVDGFNKQDSLLENFYKTKIGKKTAWGLSALRRKLRVRGTGDPTDSSDN